MADVSFPSRFGLKSADNQNLFLKVYAGEVLTAFEDMNIMKGLTRSRSISSGKSAQFPVVGVATAAYHVPGEDILRETSGTVTTPKYLSRPGTEEKVISIDNLLTSNVMISDIDEAMAHWDVAQPYAVAQGRALAEKYDLSLMQVCFNGSEKSATLTSEGSWGNGGIQITDTDFTSSIDSVLDTIEEAGRQLDEADIPAHDRHFVLKPERYRAIVSHIPANNAAHNAPLGSLDTPGVGANVGMGTVQMYNGFHLHWSNRVEDLADLADNSAVETGQRGTDYTGDFTNVEAIFFQREGMATVELLGMQVQSEYMIEFQATAMVARFAVGHGVLHEAACGSVITA